ncbi:MAG: hypothetical protein A2234_10275 [Elusimicrobia bacterium RIFOXYA2_FULL_58_8]|nr:MAG: hypothetical protein A2285_07675 [Elusimicrobia bacterium RIFOXYA12_FULL_57_11]OGS14558.1 MAG: hypothetical protein A2234_10275 [Elusimicrobia bacterium RIFOXYA2_FULL_58_8]
MNSLEMLVHIAKGLGPLKDKVVFVGGSTVSLYLTDPGASTVRPTEDVDCVTQVLTRGQYYKLEQELERLGFRHVTEKGAPICRWSYSGLTADIMPTEGDVLNFKNSWYPDGYEQAISITLPGGQQVRIFSLPYFLASKLEAFNDRGHGDFLTSPDMEDIITVLDGAEHIAEEISTAPAKVKKYLVGQFKEFLQDDRFTESLEGNLRSPAGTAARVERIKKILATL